MGRAAATGVSGDAFRNRPRSPPSPEWPATTPVPRRGRQRRTETVQVSFGHDAQADETTLDKPLAVRVNAVP